MLPVGMIKVMTSLISLWFNLAGSIYVDSAIQPDVALRDRQLTTVQILDY